MHFGVSSVGTKSQILGYLSDFRYKLDCAIVVYLALVRHVYDFLFFRTHKDILNHEVGSCVCVCGLIDT
jgi:hypothetical protein